MAGQIPIRVINLKRNPERRTFMEAALGPTGWPFGFFEGVDGYALSDADAAAKQAARFKYFKRPLTKGELGCYLSHAGAIASVLDHDWAGVIVMEDDTVFQPSFYDIAMRAAALPNHDLIWFHNGPKRKRYIVARDLGDGYQLVRPFESKTGAVCYMVSRQGAAKLTRYLANIVHPIDIAMKRYWEWNGHVFNLIPEISTWTNDFDTTIEGRDTRAKNYAFTAAGVAHHYWSEVAKSAVFLGHMLNPQGPRA